MKIKCNVNVILPGYVMGCLEVVFEGKVCLIVDIVKVYFLCNTTGV